MANIFVFQCFNCQEINMFRQASDENIILQCWHCDKLQVLPPAKEVITLDKFNELVQKRIGAEALAAENKPKLIRQGLQPASTGEA